MTPLTISDFLTALIEWVVVPPIIVLFFVYYLFGLPKNITDANVRASVRAGGVAGLIALILFMITHNDPTLAFTFQTPMYAFNLTTTLIGAAAGFITYRVLDLLMQSRLIGLLVLALVATTGIAAYSYVFIVDLRSTIIFSGLGFAFGALLHEVFFPKAGSRETTEEEGQRRTGDVHPVR